MNNKESAIKLFKNIVKSTKDVRAIINAFNGAYEISPTESIDWFKQISSNPNYKNDYYIRETFFKLLPKIVNEDKSAASQIFYNLLDPEILNHDISLANIAPRKNVRADTMAIYGAKLIITELFEKAPKEFAKITFDLILKYHDIPKKSQSGEILDVAATIWYEDNPPYEEVELLKKIEEQSIKWSENKDERVDEVIEVFDSEPYSLAKLILIQILLANPEKHFEKILKASNTILITVDDVQHFLPLCLHQIMPNCTAEQIEDINSTMLNHPIYQDEKGMEDIGERKFLLSAIPEKFRNTQIKTWLATTGKDTKIMETRGERGPPIVFSSVETPKEEEKFDDLSEKNQEKIILQIIKSWENKTTKSEKINLLENIESFLQKDKGKLDDILLFQLEPIIQTFLNDPDPIENDVKLKDDQIGSSSLLTYSTVRATAAACLLRMTYHRPTSENIALCQKISQDTSSLVREDIAKNLRYLAFGNFQTSFNIAKKFLKDNHRVLFYLMDYVRFIVARYPDESFYFCDYFLNTRGKERPPDSRDFVLENVTSITIHMALKQNNKKFSELFEKILRENSYNYVVKHTIAFRCKDKSLLLDDSLSNKILEVYDILFDSPDSSVRNDADFFLLHTIIDEKKSFLPEIKPILQKIADLNYDASADHFLRLNIIDYIGKFWKEIPEDSVKYIITLYEKNPNLVTNLHKSRDIIETMRDMFQSDLIQRNSKQKLISTLMQFVKSGWPEANQVLKIAETSI